MKENKMHVLAGLQLPEVSALSMLTQRKEKRQVQEMQVFYFSVYSWIDVCDYKYK